MKKIDVHNIFSDSDCIPEKKLFEYIDSKLNAKDKYDVEKHIAGCEICSDALEGLASVKNRNTVRKSLKFINSSIDKYSFHKKNKIIPLNLPVKIAIAATFAVLIGISFLFTHYMTKNVNNKNMAENMVYRKNVEDQTIAPVPDADTIKNLKPDTKNDKSFVFYSKKTMISMNIGDGYGELKTLPKKGGDIPTETIIDSINEELPYTKTPLIDKDETSKEIGDTRSESIDNKLSDDKSSKPDNDQNELSGGHNLKVNESEKNSGNKVVSNKKINKFSDIINTKVKQKENNAPKAPTVQISSVVINETYNNALEKFDAMEYNQAKQLFEQILVNDKNNYSALYYKALCLYHLEDYKSCITGFNDVLKIKNGAYFDSANWYKALALIKNGDIKEARTLLKEIMNSNSTYKKEAEQKLNEI